MPPVGAAETERHTAHHVQRRVECAFAQRVALVRQGELVGKPLKAAHPNGFILEVLKGGPARCAQCIDARREELKKILDLVFERVLHIIRRGAGGGGEALDHAEPAQNEPRFTLELAERRDRRARHRRERDAELIASDLLRLCEPCHRLAAARLLQQLAGAEHRFDRVARLTESDVAVEGDLSDGHDVLARHHARGEGVAAAVIRGQRSDPACERHLFRMRSEPEKAQRIGRECARARIHRGRERHRRVAGTKHQRRTFERDLRRQHDGDCERPAKDEARGFECGLHPPTARRGERTDRHLGREAHGTRREGERDRRAVVGGSRQGAATRLDGRGHRARRCGRGGWRGARTSRADRIAAAGDEQRECDARGAACCGRRRRGELHERIRCWRVPFGQVNAGLSTCTHETSGRDHADPLPLGGGHPFPPSTRRAR